MAQVKPTPRVTAVGDLFRGQMSQLAAHAENTHQANAGEEQLKWYAPNLHEWDGNPFDQEGLHKAFLRERHESEFMSAVSNTSQPGVTGDLVASQIQGDVLASMERAYRSRLRTSVRNKQHAAARRYGHGDPTNVVIMLGQVSYIERIIKASNT